MKKVKQETWPKHMQGKFCGYDLYEDGSISVAQHDYEKMDAAIREEDAIRTILLIVTDHCTKLLRKTESAKREFFSAIADNYGLDLETMRWDYNIQHHRLSAHPKNETGR